MCATLLALLAILLCLSAPGPAARILAAAQTWLADHDRQIMIAISLIFGLLLTYKGLAELLG